MTDFVKIVPSNGNSSSYKERQYSELVLTMLHQTALSL